MDVMEAVRALGVSIQADEHYKKFVAAREAAEANEEVMSVGKELENMQTVYEGLATQETPDEAALAKLQADYMEAIQKMQAIPCMAELERAREGMNDMMNDVMQIIYLAVNGEDPMTCQPSPETLQQIQGQMMSM